MKLESLIDVWERHATGELTPETISLRLPVEDAARLYALAEMYPRRSREELAADLLSAALSELESMLPYQPGSKVIARDELGDPLYEDVGPTPRYLSLSRKYRELYQRNSEPCESR